MECKPTDSLVKKMFQMQLSVKKVILIFSWDIKGSISIDFFEKVATVNSASDCQLQRRNSPRSLNDLHLILLNNKRLQGLFFHYMTLIFRSDLLMNLT